MAVRFARRRFSVDDYSRMAEAGILGEDDRVELIDGEVIEMPPIGPEHAGGVRRLATLFRRAIGDAAIVDVQNPVRLDEHSEPVPDLALLRHRHDLYASSHPTPEDVLLLVEVAKATVEYDRRVKAPLYARAGITEYWLVDLNRDVVVVYRGPHAAGYSVERAHRRGEQISPLAFPHLQLSVADLLG
jgi:Uma2 family endonuclease